jgi:hypothetical protein
MRPRYGKDGALTGPDKEHAETSTLALFWSNVNHYGTLRLDMDARLDLGPAVAVPSPRTSLDTATRSATELR